MPLPPEIPRDPFAPLLSGIIASGPASPIKPVLITPPLANGNVVGEDITVFVYFDILSITPVLGASADSQETGPPLKGAEEPELAIPPVTIPTIPFTRLPSMPPLEPVLAAEDRLKLLMKDTNILPRDSMRVLKYCIIPILPDRNLLRSDPILEKIPP
jgi:hypothetical protein